MSPDATKSNCKKNRSYSTRTGSVLSVNENTPPIKLGWVKDDSSTQPDEWFTLELIAIAWGNEELASGNTKVAAQVYSRAWTKGTESQQRQLIDRIAQTFRLSDSPAEILELALKVVERDPAVSFGERDYLIAQALVSREGAADSGSIDIWHTRPSASLELVRQRLELALEHGVPEAMRMEVDEALAAVKIVLTKGQPDVRYEPDFLYRLPKGTAQELIATVNDESQAIWTRGKAAMAMGRQLESDGNRN